MFAASGQTESDVVALAAALEPSSERPLAAAIVAAAAERKSPISEATNFASTTGEGVSGDGGGRNVALGNAKLMAAHNVALDALQAKAEAFRHDGNGALCGR